VCSVWGSIVVVVAVEWRKEKKKVCWVKGLRVCALRLAFNWLNEAAAAAAAAAAAGGNKEKERVLDRARRGLLMTTTPPHIKKYLLFSSCLCAVSR